MDPEFKVRVGDSWNNEIRGTIMYQLVGKLNMLKKVLQRLNRNKFSDIELKAEQAKEELEKCRKQIQRSPTNKSLFERSRNWQTIIGD